MRRLRTRIVASIDGTRLDRPIAARHNYPDNRAWEMRVARRREDDPKVSALRETRSLNPRPGAVSDEAFASAEFLDARDLVQVKYEMVRRVRVEGEPVARAAQAFGFSRPSF